MAGTCAIAVFTFAYVGKQLYRASSKRWTWVAYEAMEALGATRLPGLYYRRCLPAGAAYVSVRIACSALEGNVRYASILGYVGAGGLGLIMNEKIGWREYDSRRHDPDRPVFDRYGH